MYPEKRVDFCSSSSWLPNRQGLVPVVDVEGMPFLVDASVSDPVDHGLFRTVSRIALLLLHSQNADFLLRYFFLSLSQCTIIGAVPFSSMRCRIKNPVSKAFWDLSREITDKNM